MTEMTNGSARVAVSGKPGNSFEQIISNGPNAMARWWSLEEELRFNGLVDSDIKGEVRRAMAPEAGCKFCASLAPAKDSYPTARESLAVAYSLMLARDPKDLDDSVFDVLREEFSDPEIVELTMWALFMYASQAFGAALRVPAADDEEKVAYAQSRRAELP